MSILDVDERIEQANKQVDLYLCWKAEDDEFQKKRPDSLMYSWFAEHSNTWKPTPDKDEFLALHEPSILEKEYGKIHRHFGPGNSIFLILFFCSAKHMVDIVKPGIPPDKSKASTISKLTSFSKTIGLSRANISIPSQDETQEIVSMSFPSVISLKNVAEWPDWLIDSRNCRCKQPWDNVTFWVDDSCNTTQINNLIYRPGISHGDPDEYNFFRPSDYFIRI